MLESVSDVAVVGSWDVFVCLMCQAVHYFRGVSARSAFLRPHGSSKGYAFVHEVVL